jgi:hypothetical protein
VKKGIEVWPDYDQARRWVLKIKKAKGKFTLDEIREIAMEYEQDFYALIIKAVDEDMMQYYDDIETGDYIELYRATDFLRGKET